MLTYAQAFIILWLYRYVRLVVNIVSWCRNSPIPIPKTPAIQPSDSTIIIPTVSGLGIEFLTCLRLCLQTAPLEILVVTTHNHVPNVVRLLQEHYLSTSVRVLGVPRANKRLQLLRGLEEVESKVTIFADDDVFWPRNFLINLLAAFEDPTVGSAGSCQRVRRATRIVRPNAWHVLGAFRLIRRNFETCATAHIDGGVSCLSGRTAAYRTSALRTAEFEHEFSTEKWLHRAQFYSFYAVYLKTLFPPTALFDPLMGYLLYEATSGLTQLYQALAMATFTLWLLGAKAVKLLPHLKEHPEDIMYLPAEILFGYAHGLLEAYAIATLTSVAWGGRELGQKATTDEHRYDETPKDDQALCLSLEGC